MTKLINKPNITLVAPELQEDKGYSYQPLKSGGNQKIYNEQKWLYENGFYNKIKGNKGAQEIDGLEGVMTKAARQAALKAGYKKDKSGNYVKVSSQSPSKTKLIKSPTLMQNYDVPQLQNNISVGDQVYNQTSAVKQQQDYSQRQVAIQTAKENAMKKSKYNEDVFNRQLFLYENGFFGVQPDYNDISKYVDGIAGKQTAAAEQRFKENPIEAPKPQFQRYESKENKFAKIYHLPANLTDLALTELNKAGVIPAHVALPLKDLNQRAVNSGPRLLGRVQYFINGMPWKEAGVESDKNPTQLQKYITLVPRGLDERSFTEEELAELGRRAELSKDNGAINARGNRARNQELGNASNYAAEIPNQGFFSPQSVAEWAVGQSSTINENGYKYLYDRYAFDTKDTEGVYSDPSRWKEHPMMGIRFIMGHLGSKGYDDGKNSYSSIPIQIPFDKISQET